MEEKVYARCVNKTGLALRVIDKQSIKKLYTAKELADLTAIDTWVQCDKCDKWRMLLAGQEAPEGSFYCNMNVNDPRNDCCTAPERTALWYSLNRDLSISGSSQDGASFSPDVSHQNAADDVLNHLVTVTVGQEPVVKRHYYHESLLRSVDSASEVAAARELLGAEPSGDTTFNNSQKAPSNEKPVSSEPEEELPRQETGYPKEQELLISECSSSSPKQALIADIPSSIVKQTKRKANSPPNLPPCKKAKIGLETMQGGQTTATSTTRSRGLKDGATTLVARRKVSMSVESSPASPASQSSPSLKQTTGSITMPLRKLVEFFKTSVTANGRSKEKVDTDLEKKATSDDKKSSEVIDLCDDSDEAVDS